MIQPYRDPLAAVHPGAGLAHVRSYWAATVGTAPEDDGALLGEGECDVAIIGGGYTGLSCALTLASRYGMKPLILEANQVGWGCSGRNGSFARPAIGRLPYADWTRTFGEAGARALFAEALAALETTRSLIGDNAIDCDQQPDGWLKIAHRASRVDALLAEARLLREVFDFDAEFLDAERLAAEHLQGGEAFGALRWPVSFAMHPLKLAYGLAGAARKAGVRLHTGSPVLSWRKSGAAHVLSTPQGCLRARRVVVATNGYTLERRFPIFRGRLLPVLSNIVVTQPMTAAEQASGGLRTTDCLTDTRSMLYYYRRLPDDRIMLGGKGPLRQHPAGMEASKQQLLRAIAAKFPFMAQPRAEFFWGGWVAITRDSIPHVSFAKEDESVIYSLGYMGSGVSMSCHAGRRMAEALAGEPLALPAPIRRSLPRFPFAAFRRIGQKIMMKHYVRQDRSD